MNNLHNSHHPNTTLPITGEMINSLLPQRFPFLFVDCIDAFEPFKWIKGSKCVAPKEPYLLSESETHWPMPFAIESMGQFAIALFNLSQSQAENRKVLLGSVGGVNYLQPIPLGCKMDFDVKIEKFINDQFIASGQVYIGDNLCMTMETLICKILESGA